MRAAFALLLIVLGVTTGWLGANRLSSLSASYRHIDLFLTETPESFQAWLREVMREDLADEGLSEPSAATRIAGRLLITGIDKRRAIAVAMLQNDFWQPLAREGETPREARSATLAGVLDALHQAPMAADLYLAAAALDISLSGFTEQTQSLLQASQSFGPHELPLVMARLDLAPRIWDFMDDTHRSLFAEDLAVVRQVAPDRADRIEAALATAGVVFR